MAKSDEPITIKKYANRRLYNTGTSTYVTLEDLAVMVKAGEDFVVYDAKTGEDITRSVLTQIIFEQENKEGQNLLPINFLRQLIRFYGDSMQMLVPRYLEVSIDSLTREQDKFREQMTQAFGVGGFGPLEDQVRRNMEMFEAHLRDVRAVRASGQNRRRQAAAEPDKRAKGRAAARSTTSSARSTRCRSGSIAWATKASHPPFRDKRNGPTTKRGPSPELASPEGDRRSRARRLLRLRRGQARPTWDRDEARALCRFSRASARRVLALAARIGRTSRTSETLDTDLPPTSEDDVAALHAMLGCGAVRVRRR